MKRKYGAALARETLAEQKMRERAADMHDNSRNFGSKSRMAADARQAPRRYKRRPPEVASGKSGVRTTGKIGLTPIFVAFQPEKLRLNQPTRASNPGRRACRYADLVQRSSDLMRQRQHRRWRRRSGPCSTQAAGWSVRAMVHPAALQRLRALTRSNI
jgi:hypothetical protein